MSERLCTCGAETTMPHRPGRAPCIYPAPIERYNAEAEAQEAELRASLEPWTTQGVDS